MFVFLHICMYWFCAFAWFLWCMNDWMQLQYLLILFCLCLCFCSFFHSLLNAGLCIFHAWRCRRHYFFYIPHRFIFLLIKIISLPEYSYQMTKTPLSWYYSGKTFPHMISIDHFFYKICCINGFFNSICKFQWCLLTKAVFQLLASLSY